MSCLTFFLLVCVRAVFLFIPFNTLIQVFMTVIICSMMQDFLLAEAATEHRLLLQLIMDEKKNTEKCRETDTKTVEFVSSMLISADARALWFLTNA